MRDFELGDFGDMIEHAVHFEYRIKWCCERYNFNGHNIWKSLDPFGDEEFGGEEDVRNQIETPLPKDEDVKKNGLHLFLYLLQLS